MREKERREGGREGGRERRRGDSCVYMEILQIGKTNGTTTQDTT